jgi:hypothetical protein
MENKSPLGVSSPKLSSSRQNVHFQFFASSCCWSILGIGFLQKFETTVALETSLILFACTAVAPPDKSFLPTVAQFPIAPAPPSPRDTSPSPAPQVRVFQVKMFQSSSKGHQPMFDPPLSVLPVAEPTPTQPIPDYA